ncbi:MAG: fatty acid desaturase [Novosphingobium sp.]
MARNAPSLAAQGKQRRREPLTLLVAFVIYGGWLALTYWHDALPLPVLAVLGGLIVAWHGSLQHETIHGHPTGNQAIDGAIGFVPLALWLPYPIYRASHLAHHATGEATDPEADPESHYRAEARGWGYRLARIEAPLWARLTLGPPIRIGRFLVAELRRARSEPGAWLRDWLPHLAALVPVLWWLSHVELSLGTYLVAFVYPGTALTLLRSFAEHHADADPRRRAAIVTRGGVFGLLFLNNNLHAVHHARPDLAWYRLPAFFEANRAAFAAAPTYASYGEVVRRYAWRPQDGVVHPRYRRSARAAA